jgi:hypothetical protein
MRYVLILAIFFYACKSPSEFLTPNEVHREKVDLVFRDQKKVTGEINILYENSSSMYSTYSQYIQFDPAGKDSFKTININEISGYWFESNYYALKKVDIHMNGIYRLLFLKRLTGENSKIQLYELYESGRGNGGVDIEYTYFLTYPSCGCGPLDVINTRSSLIIPSFEQKMSLLVEDCPSLAQKILAKDKGYFIPVASFNIKKHPEVLMRIIDEYNQCN